MQAGVFDSAQEADALARRLQKDGYSTTISKDAPYRVWVGGYLDRPTAEQLIRNLQQVGFTATMVP